MEKREYPVTSDFAPLIQELTDFLGRQNLDVHNRPEGSATVLIAGHPSSWRDHLGLKRSLTIKISPAVSGNIVEVGNQKWLNKAAPAVAGVVLGATGVGLIPLGTAAFGAHTQYRLTTEVWGIIERFMTAEAGKFYPRLKP